MQSKVSFHDDPILRYNPDVKREILGERLYYSLEDFPYELEIEGKPATKNPLDTQPRYSLHGLHPKEGCEVVDQNFETMSQFFAKLGYTEMKAISGKPIKFRRDKTPSQKYWPIFSVYDTYSKGDWHDAKYLLISYDKKIAYFHARKRYEELVIKAEIEE